MNINKIKSTILKYTIGTFVEYYLEQYFNRNTNIIEKTSALKYIVSHKISNFPFILNELIKNNFTSISLSLKENEFKSYSCPYADTYIDTKYLEIYTINKINKDKVILSKIDTTYPSIKIPINCGVLLKSKINLDINITTYPTSINVYELTNKSLYKNDDINQGLILAKHDNEYVFTKSPIIIEETPILHK